MRKKSVLMTIDEEIITMIALIAAAEWTNRSAITREALSMWIDNYNYKNPIGSISKKVKKNLDSKIKTNDANSSSKWSSIKDEDNSSWWHWEQLKWSDMNDNKDSQSEMMSDRDELMSAWVWYSSWDSQREQVEDNIHEPIQDTEQGMGETEGATATRWKELLKWESEMDEYESSFPIG